MERFLNDYAGQLKLQEFVASIADPNSRHLASRLRRLKELKVDEVYVALTLHNMQAEYDQLLKSPERFIYAIVPVPDGTEPASIAKALADDPPRSNTTRTSKNAAGNLLVQRGFGPVESTWLALHFYSAVHVDDAAHGNVILAGPPDLLEYLVKAPVRDRLARSLSAGRGW